VARPLRLEVAGGVYHVTARGNERRAIYRDDADRRVVFEHACEATYGDPAYGGNRRSGLGREGVRFAMEEMTNIQMVAIRLGS